MAYAIIVACISAVVTIFIWAFEQREKRIYEQYKRKEERYSNLIVALKGFYLSSRNQDLVYEFLNQVNLCWLYCPDEIIIKAYNFLSKVQTSEKYADEIKEQAVGELIIAIRKDLIARKPLKKTELNAKNFKHLRAT